jgi:5,5'-dehydrodivanillate O-demethylase
MLTQEQNETLTRVGPGTPCGELLRRYWQPVCFAKELRADHPVKRVRLLGEDLVLFRSADGSYGLVAEQCSHRGASLYYGFLEDGGIRCPYHGWLYDNEGRCLEQPFEPAQSIMKHTLRHTAYPVEELAGLMFAYMGPPERRPLLPHWDALARQDGRRRWTVRPLACNWLQAEENTPDFTHTYYLHAHNLKIRGLSGGEYYYRPFVRYGFRPFEWGLVKFWEYGGDDPETAWGHPLMFPNMQRVEAGGISHHWRVPIDDTQSVIYQVTFSPNKDGRPEPQPAEPAVEFLRTARDGPDGDYELTSFPSQDHMAWETEGPIYDRTKEHLGHSDLGIAMFREMLQQQIEVVQAGGEPIGLVRDPEQNDVISVISREDGFPDDLDGVTWVHVQERPAAASQGSRVR